MCFILTQVHYTHALKQHSEVLQSYAGSLKAQAHTFYKIWEQMLFLLMLKDKYK